MRFLILIFACCGFLTLSSQEHIDTFCSSTERNNEALSKNPNLELLKQQQNEFAWEYTEKHYGKSNQTGKKTITYIIPVVWHILHNNGPENVDKSVIEAEIAALNEDFRKLNSDISNVHPAFAGIAADCEIEFRLARLDPNGNCTEGIVRTQSNITYAMEEEAKFISPAWNTAKYFNIWMGISIAGGAGGYAYYPGWAPSQEQEGIVLRYQQLGNTVTHEVGHWLNLPHCWGSTNTPQDPDNCNYDDDVADTPNTVGQTGCLATASSCGSLDNVQNYMEYNFCSVMFTEGQKMRMHAALNSSMGLRDNLWTPSNLIETGVADPYELNPICTPLADFTFNKRFVCIGDQVTFQDDSYNATPTGWNWTFEGGTPYYSSIASPTITYDTAGIFNVTYEPFTTNGSGFNSKEKLIIVSSLFANYAIPFSEGFETPSTIENEWVVITTANNGWENSSIASATGSNCMMINNFDNEASQIAELISPAFDLTTLSNPRLDYKWAFAKKNSSSNDQFVVYYSDDCGSSWTVLSAKIGTNLETAPMNASPFVPQNTSEWDSTSIDLSSIANETNVRFKFRLRNNKGNNLFLDDVNLKGDISTSIQPFNPIHSIAIYPNPMNENTVIAFNLKNNVNNLNIVLRDVLGNEVTRIVNNTNFSAGKYTLAIDKEKKLSSGLYFIEFNADNHIETEKLIVK